MTTAANPLSDCRADGSGRGPVPGLGVTADGPLYGCRQHLLAVGARVFVTAAGRQVDPHPGRAGVAAGSGGCGAERAEAVG